LVNESQAANIYVDWQLSSDCTSGTYSIANRNCNGADGRAYNTIQEAVNAMNGGDDIYIRGDHTYNECVLLPHDKDGTAPDWSSIQSYHDEWAVIDCNGGAETALGRRDSGSGIGYEMKYWKIERLEVTGGCEGRASPGAGIDLDGGPFIIRYCYIHDNKCNDGNENPGGIRGYMWQDSIIEYNFLKDNGCSSGDIYNCGDITAITDYRDSTTACGSGWSPSQNSGRYLGRNEYRYNFFAGGAQSLHIKNDQLFSRRITSFQEDYDDYGDKFHHNIIVDYSASGILAPQDFIQIYNNIVDGASIPFGVGISIDYEQFTPKYKTCIYNNNVLAGDSSYAPIAVFAGLQGWSCDGSILRDMKGYIYNNIVYNSRNAGGRYCYSPPNSGINVAHCDTDFNVGNFYVDSNYFYDPYSSISQDLFHFDGIAYTLSEFESSGPTAPPRNGYVQAYDSNNPLYVGTSGADKYKTRANHILEGSTTIANGGIGGAHPYLSGVQIPSYVGAVNPNDNAWVDGVLGLATVSNLQNTPSGDPNWIEGANSDTTPPAAPTGLNVQ
jgi:hypothetical protein